MIYDFFDRAYMTFLYPVGGQTVLRGSDDVLTLPATDPQKIVMQREGVGFISLTLTVQHVQAVTLTLTLSSLETVDVSRPIADNAVSEISDHYFCVSERSVTRGQPCKLFLPRCSSNVRKHYFCHCIVKVWNDLPGDTDFTSIGAFGGTVRRFNLLVYCDKDW